MTKLLENQTAIVTGGSRGIGRAIALGLAAAGANIALVYGGNSAAAEEVCGLLTELGVKNQAYCCDVADFAKAEVTVKTILADFGQVNILVNNAGIVRDGLVLTMTEADYDAVLNTNLKGAFNFIKQCYKPMMRQRSGRIINITSVAGLMGNAGQANYAAAKAGMVGLTKSVAKELAARSITCNAIAPGFIKTDMTESLSEAVKNGAADAIPMKAMGKPEDIASLAIFLAGPGGDYITGEVIKVDGGLYI